MAPSRLPAMKSPVSSSLQNLCCLLLITSTEAFTGFTRPSAFVSSSTRKSTASTRQMIYAPPGSGYAGPEDEESPLPDTYLPMMEYPGTMRPGRTPENMPFQDLPIGDDDAEPIPWPHLQQIEWHHKWDPPHPNPIPMEEFIEMQGRWATPEMEAAMRVGVRRGVRAKQEKEAKERDSFVITDDDEDDAGDEPVSLGDSVFGELGSAADEAITADAARPKAEGEDEEEDEGEYERTEEDDLDNFLLDLGLDADVDMDTMGDDDSTAQNANKKSKKAVDDDNEVSTLDLLSEGGDISGTINVEDDDDLDLGLDDDDEMGDGVSTVPLEDFDDSNDPMEGEDIFDDGGFDFDGDFDDGDVW